MKKKKYIVLRSHIGDKFYNVGDERTDNPAAVAHLVGKVLKPKAARSRSNKAVQTPQNKGSQ